MRVHVSLTCPHVFFGQQTSYTMFIMSESLQPEDERKNK